MHKKKMASLTNNFKKGSNYYIRNEKDGIEKRYKAESAGQENYLQCAFSKFTSKVSDD